MSGLTPLSPAVKPRSRGIWRVASISLVTLTLLVTGGVTLHVLSRQATRLTRLEVAQNTRPTREALSSLQASFSALATRTGALESQLNQVAGEMASLERRPQTSPEMAAQIQQLRQEEQALSDRVAHLQAKDSPAPDATPAKVQAVPAVIPRPETKPTPRSSRSHSVLAQSAPFVLTGTERRGTQLLAAVAPRGFDHLSQVQLVSTGDAFMGWVLVEVDPHQAQFRAGHRRLTLSCGE
jgi:BMFP domain-containing protein YqiC